MKEKNWDALCANMDILKTGLDSYISFELKGNLADFTVQNIGEMGDIFKVNNIQTVLDPFP